MTKPEDVFFYSTLYRKPKTEQVFLVLSMRTRKWGEASFWTLCHKVLTDGDQWWLTFWNILQFTHRISGAHPQWSWSLSCVWSRSFSSDYSVWPDSQLWKESWLFQSFSFRMMKARNLLSGTCSRRIFVAFSSGCLRPLETLMQCRQS